MTPSASIDQTRRSALSLLADGNGVESVAHVLGVPVDVVASWQRGEQVAWSADEAATPPPAEPSLRIYDADVVHAESPGVRQLTLVAGVYVVALAIALGSAVALRYRFDGLIIVLLACLPLGFLGVWLVAGSRVRFVFGSSEMTERGAWSTRRLAYADVERTTIATDFISGGKGARIPGLRVTIASRLADDPPLSLFIADTGPRPVDVIHRVKAMPGTSAAELALFNRPRPPAREPSPIFSALAILATVFACCWLLNLPEIGWGGALHGLPAFEQLQRIDGDLVRSSGCLTHKPFTQDVTLRVDSGVTQTKAIQCLLEADPLRDGHPHRMTMYQDVGGNTYQVEIDGRPLLSYGTAKAQNTAWRAFRALIALAFTLLPVIQILSVWRQFAGTRD